MTEATTLVSPTSPPAVHCLGCEYDLRGLTREANCPECGTPVAPSWERHDAERAAQLPPLHLSSPSWLRAMAVACCFMLVTMLLSGIDALRTVSGADSVTLNVVTVAVGLSELAARLIGLWLFAAREPLRSETRAAGSGGGRASRYLLRAIAVMSVALPFAMVPLMDRYAGALLFDEWSAVAFAALAGAAAWVVMRRLAAAARRARRRFTALVATVLAWVSLPLWVAHAAIDSSILIGEHSWWQLYAHPVIGYAQSAVVIPFVLATHGWDASMGWWVPEALVSLASAAVMIVIAPVLFTAAARSPRVASRDGE